MCFLPEYEILRLEPNSALPIPLRLSNARISVKPDGRVIVPASPVNASIILYLLFQTFLIIFLNRLPGQKQWVPVKQ